MNNSIKEAYQIESIKKVLRDKGYDLSEALDIIDSYDSNVDRLRYRYDINDSDLNLYWYMAHGIR